MTGGPPKEYWPISRQSLSWIKSGDVPAIILEQARACDAIGINTCVKRGSNDDLRNCLINMHLRSNIAVGVAYRGGNLAPSPRKGGDRKGTRTIFFGIWVEEISGRQGFEST